MDDGTIYLVRHGETAWNVEGRIQGQLDSELTARGTEQARALGQLLRRHVISRAFAIESSPSGRAMTTARLVAEELGCDPATIRISPLLAERKMGRWAGLTMDEVEAAFPELDARRAIDDPNHVVPGGEDFEALVARARGWLASPRPAAVTIAVTHGLIGRTIRGVYLRKPTDWIVTSNYPQDLAFVLNGGRIEELLA